MKIPYLLSLLGLVGCLAATPGALAAETLRVGVLPLGGNAPAPLRAEGTQTLLDALGGLARLSVVSLARIDAVLGPAAKRALEACTDDPCLVQATQGIKTDRLVIGSLDVEGDKTLLRLRLIESSTVAKTPIARVTRDVGRDADPLRSEVSAAVLELFPERAKESVGTVEILGALPGARIVVDGRMSTTVPLDAIDPEAPAILKLPPGTHEIRVVAPGYFPRTERAQVLVGQRTSLAFDLEKNRSNGPLILGGVGAAAGVGGAILGALAATKVGDWKDACLPRMPCEAGFTRERYLSDEQAIDQQRTAANVLFGVAGAAIAGAVIWYFLDPGSEVVE